MVVALALVGALFGGALAWPGGDGEPAAALATGDAGARAAAALAIGRDEPGGAARLLLPGLRDRDVGVRLLAARLLVRRGSAEAAAAVAVWLGSPSAQDRTLALAALRDAAALTPEARRGAERALADGDAPARVLALDVLAAHPVVGDLGPLLRALDDDERGVRLRAVRALAAARDGRAGLALLARTADADRQVRAEAVAALAAVGDVRTVPALRRWLDDAASDVRGDAATALGRLRAFSAVPSLARLAARWPRDELARRALAALGEIATPPALDALIAAAREPVGAADVRLAFTLAGKRALPALARELAEGTTTSGNLAAAALGDLGDRAATPALLAALARPDVAPAAANALARLGDPAAVAPLLSAATSGEPPRARTSALEALAALGDARARAAVEPGLAATDARVRAAACRLAGGLDAHHAAPALARRLADADADVRRAAATALARVARPSPDVATLLIAAMVRTASAPDDIATLEEALARATDARAAAAIEGAYIKAPAPLTRAALARALTAAHASTPITATNVIDQLTRDLSADEPLARAAADALAGAPLSRAQGDAVLVAFAGAAPGVKAAVAPTLARVPGGAAALAATERDPEEVPAVRAAAAQALATHAAAPARWVGFRLLAADGVALPGQRIQVVVGGASVWTTTDLEGRARVTGLPAGPAEVTLPNESPPRSRPADHPP